MQTRVYYNPYTWLPDSYHCERGLTVCYNEDFVISRLHQSLVELLTRSRVRLGLHHVLRAFVVSSVSIKLTAQFTHYMTRWPMVGEEKFSEFSRAIKLLFHEFTNI